MSSVKLSTAQRPGTQSLLVSRELDRLLSARDEQVARYGPEFARLWQHARARAIGGKLLRPRLLLGAFDALSQARESAAIAEQATAVRMAAMTEILHYSFLLHDDVIDGDLSRRGQLNLIGAVLEDRVRHVSRPGQFLADDRERRDLHWAKTSGILMGDLFLAIAHQIVAREALPADARLRMLDLLDHTIVESIAGEHLDVGLSTGAVSASPGAVLRMSQLKTATYTFEFPLRTAAILASAPPRVDHILGKIGRALGLAFQLQDDLLSTFGQPDEHGKDAFSDLREGKETALIAHARGTAEWPHIASRLGRQELHVEECRDLRDRLRACGAERAVATLITEQVAECEEICAAEAAVLPPALTQFISELVTELDGRRT
ncbi:polyprenyl synthetase family protein [Leucobacter sp. 7(1)]|uniref:polyprenyl synthetase family protein n=1 Tax=Leucobacter sp. 7(1) TaxID=1255613 RepID=UPI000B360631|nr:polyprenyl synthetase family protein [Leucobacter sp. 7(1)]